MKIKLAYILVAMAVGAIMAVLSLLVPQSFIYNTDHHTKIGEIMRVRDAYLRGLEDCKK